jgi:hypothetical protein
MMPLQWACRQSVETNTEYITINVVTGRISGSCKNFQWKDALEQEIGCNLCPSISLFTFVTTQSPTRDVWTFYFTLDDIITVPDSSILWAMCISLTKDKIRTHCCQLRAVYFQIMIIRTLVNKSTPLVVGTLA